MKTLYILAGIAAALFLLVWLGLNLKPAPFPAYPKQTTGLETIPLPGGLPAPVERFYRQTYGKTIPVIHSAVVSGRGTMAPFGVKIPMRFRFYYQDNRDFLSVINATFYGLTIMNAEESFIDGRGLGKMPYGLDQGEKFDQGITVRFWAEILTWFPAALLTDERVRWEPVDDATALLVVPFGERQERFVVRFDPRSGGVQYFEIMRYYGSGEKKLWVNGTWFDDGKPWLHLEVEEKLFNAAVQEAFQGASSAAVR